MFDEKQELKKSHGTVLLGGHSLLLPGELGSRTGEEDPSKNEVFYLHLIN
jgi:hypothetical protein